MTHLGLTINETKTRLCNARLEHFDFLGYTFGPERFRKDGHWYLAATPSKKAIRRLRGRIRETLRTGIVAPWPEVRDRLNRKLQGWSNYFSIGTRTMAYRIVDNFVQTAVRNFLQRRHKVPGRGTRRFSDAVVYGERGVRRLRWVQLGRPAGAIS
jgi:RNA-directed DNA polymerase